MTIDQLRCLKVPTLPIDTKTTTTGKYIHERTYTNTLPCKVSIRHRSGLLVEIIPVGLSQGEIAALAIAEKHTGNINYVKFNGDGLLNASSIHTPERAQALAQSGIPQTFMSQTKTENLYALDYDTLKQNGGNLYLSDLDVVVSLNTGDEVPAHPFSYESTLQTKDDKTSIEFKLVDNVDALGTRYLNAFGDIIAVKPERDPRLSNGLHVYYRMPRYDVNGNVKDVHQVIPMEQLEGDHLYASFTTIDELRVRMKQKDSALKKAQLELNTTDIKDTIEVRKLEAQLKTQEFDLKKQEFENHRLVLQQQLDAAEYRVKQAQEVVEQSRREMEQMRKDYYDRRSYERKDDSEVLKYAILIGTAIFAFMKR